LVAVQLSRVSTTAVVGMETLDLQLAGQEEDIGLAIEEARGVEEVLVVDISELEEAVESYNAAEELEVELTVEIAVV
jgi:hypothetical protein